MGVIAKKEMESIKNNVERVTYGLNVLLLTWHIFFAIFFYLGKVEIPFYANIISILAYCLAFYLLVKKKFITYAVMTCVEIYLFMIMAVVCFGWEYGFQQWCMGFISSIIFIDFMFNSERKIKKQMYIQIYMVIFTYIIMRIWTYNNNPIYSLEYMSDRYVYIFNSIVGFSFMVGYSVYYIKNVYRLEYELSQKARLDSMTGLANRRSMSEYIEKIKKSNTGKDICVAIIDVDFFKSINDTYGHEQGDIVLKKMAEVLKEKCTKENGFFVGRWGGEEFMVLYKTENEDKEIENLVKIADENLYKGKENGRNTVVRNL